MKVKLDTLPKTLTLTTEARAEVTEALRAVNGNATAFTLSTAGEVQSVLMDLVNYLDTNIVPPSDWAGVKATYRPGGPSANAYKRSAISTKITITRSGGAWYLTDVTRVDVWPRNPERLTVSISDRAARNLVRRSLKAFGRTELPSDQQVAA